ncbi:MAG: nucleotidyltransferase domain-containing protein [Chloroflexi bacterium]|nr:MAG: nucleotidyltransferase domain-containing protein [Chloroflexota bacterium]
MVTKASQPAPGFNRELTEIIHRFCQALEKAGIHCQQILLYGSQRSGKAREGSDIDLIVVSPDWARYGWRERLELLGITAARILEPIQAQGFTPDEIAQRDISPFWQYILDHEATIVSSAF